MTYKEAEQRLKELLSTGFIVRVGRNYDTSLEVEKLFYELYESDKTLFKVGDVFKGGSFFGAGKGRDDTLNAGRWGYYGISAIGHTFICDEEFYLVVSESELREIVEAFTSVSVLSSKFEAVSGDQSLFDLVEATDEHLFMVLNKRHTGIYAITQKDKDYGVYDNSVVLAERKLKEPEFIPYHTENYPHEDCKGGVMAFRSRSGETAINFEEECGRGEVVLSFENTIKFANELLAITNGVERKE